MIAELPVTPILLAVVGFLIGWVLSAVSSRIRSRYEATERDGRDDRIRSLEAELRIALSDNEKYLGELGRLEERLTETVASMERRDNVITRQQEKLAKTAKKLKESVIKTRELRHELADRAAENVHAEARIREVQTELSVAQASQEMLATGVLGYEAATSGDDWETAAENPETDGDALLGALEEPASVDDESDSAGEDLQESERPQQRRGMLGLASS